MHRQRGRARRARQDADLARTRAEQAAAAAESADWRLGATLDVLPTGIVVCGRDGEVLIRNAAAEAFASARHGEALVARAVEDLMVGALRGEPAETRVELRAAPRRAYAVEAQPITRDDAIVGAVGLVRDVTDQQRIDTVRRDFVANVSHELKTPIGALSLLADSLTADPAPQVGARLADRIHSEVQRVAGTIDDLLTLSSIEDEGCPADEVVEMGEVIGACLDRISEAAAQRGVTVAAPASASESASDPTGFVLGSRVQLESALFNLLDNAVKFSERGGRVELRTACDDASLSIIVSDDGVGIPAAEQSRIFERFYRVDRARSRHHGGTGLGLSIVRHAVLNHSGEVTVSSREGYGATFTVTLPIAVLGPASGDESGG